MPLSLQALALTGAVMGSYAIKVVRSKTAIVPVNASLLPRTEEESERCKRTVYVTNIDLGVEVWVLTLNKPVAWRCAWLQATHLHLFSGCSDSKLL